MLVPFNYEIVSHLHEFQGARLFVLMALVLRANKRMRCWPSIDTLCRDTGYARAPVTKAKQWLIERGAIEIVSFEKRAGEQEESLPRLLHVYQITGEIKLESGKIVSYLAVSKADSSLSERSESENSESERESFKKTKSKDKEFNKESADASANGDNASKHEHSKNGKTPETKEREFVFELVAFLFFGFKDMATFNNLNEKSKKTMAGRIGKIAAFLRDLYKWDEPIRALEPSAKVLAIKADCQEFCKWYATCYSNASRPRDVGKFSEHYLEWYNSKIPEFSKSKADPDCLRCKGKGEWLDKITDPYNHKFIECECVKVLS